MEKFIHQLSLDAALLGETSLIKSHKEKEIFGGRRIKIYKREIWNSEWIKKAKAGQYGRWNWSWANNGVTSKKGEYISKVCIVFDHFDAFLFVCGFIWNIYRGTLVMVELKALTRVLEEKKKNINKQLHKKKEVSSQLELCEWIWLKSKSKQLDLRVQKNHFLSSGAEKEESEDDL